MDPNYQVPKWAKVVAVVLAVLGGLFLAFIAVVMFALSKGSWG